jgi:hypothetical protein
MSTSYSRTSAQIIARAHRVLGVLSLGQVPEADQYANGLEVLNLVLKDLSMEGVILTQQSLVQINPSPISSDVIGTDGNSYSCILGHTASSLNQPVSGSDWSLYWEKYGTSTTPWISGATNTSKIMVTANGDYDSLDKAFWRQNNIDYPLTVIKYGDYLSIPDKTLTAQIPEAIGVEYTLSGMNLYIYPVPTTYTSCALRLLVVKLFNDLSSTSDTPTLSANWINYLTYKTAAFLSDEYSKPLSERQYLYQHAAELLKTCMDANNPLETQRFISGAY